MACAAEHNIFECWLGLFPEHKCFDFMIVNDREICFDIERRVV